LFEKLLEISRNGQHDEDYLTDINNLGHAYKESGRKEDARRLFLEVLENSATLGLENSSTALAAKNNLALLLNEADPGSTEVERMYEEILEVQLNHLGLAEDSISVLKTRYNLSEVYLSQERSSDAIELLEDVFSRCVTLHGPRHAIAKVCRSGLIMAYTKEGRIKDAARMLLEGELYGQGASTANILRDGNFAQVYSPYRISLTFTNQIESVVKELRSGTWINRTS